MVPIVMINIFHVLFVAPLLIYIGYAQNYSEQKPQPWVYNLLIVLGIIVFLYHGYRTVTRL